MTDMAVTGVNDQLFADVLVQIEKHPETWRQGVWARKNECGTSHCFAGHAVALSGLTFDWEPLRLGYSGDTHRALFIRDDDGDYRSVALVAAELLGISEDDAEILFHKSNRLGVLYRESARLMGIDETVLREKVQASL